MISILRAEKKGIVQKVQKVEVRASVQVRTSLSGLVLPESQVQRDESRRMSAGEERARMYAEKHRDRCGERFR